MQDVIYSGSQNTNHLQPPYKTYTIDRQSQSFLRGLAGPSNEGVLSHQSGLLITPSS